MAVEKRTYAKYFHQLLKNINGMSGGQAAVADWEDDLSSIKIVITPSDGYYKGGQFTFEIRSDSLENLESAPRVICHTMIYHPNIDTLEDDGEICLNLFDDLWTKERNLEDVVQGLLFLLYNPNLEDPLCCIFSPDMTIEEFEENVKISIEGGEVDGYEFTKHEINKGNDEEEGKEEGVKGKDGGEVDIRGEPDGAEQDRIVADLKEENKALQQLFVNNNVIKQDEQGDVLLPSACGLSCSDKINRLEYIPYSVCSEDDEGTPVDPVDRYPQMQVNEEAKVKSDVNEVCRRQESMEVKSGPGRGEGMGMNFWWGIAIRRVRGWNVFS